MITIVTDRSRWNSILNNIGVYDCYHTYEYHHISCLGDETPILICYETKAITIALPLLKRAIPESDFYDCTSVYGYAGPVYSASTTTEDFQNFQKALVQLCDNERIVSVFSRLNPFVEGQEQALDTIGKVETLGNVVAIDLNKDLELQQQEFSRTTKRYLNKARKVCYVKKEIEEGDILKFKELYYENMDRVHASDYYYFSETYFSSLINSKEFKTELLFAVLEGTNEIISGIILIKTKSMVHYHLSGTRTKFLHLNPLRLLLDQTRIDASGIAQDYDYLNLGGGLGNRQDNLFRFKSSFSKEYKTFKVWKYISNAEVYASLTKGSDYNETSFFPAYRSRTKVST